MVHLLAVLALCSAAAEPARPLLRLQGVEAAADSVTLQLSGPVQYNVFATSVPPRLVVDLLDTACAVPSKTFEVSGSALKRVRAAQFARKPDAITRVVLDLERIAAYQVRASEGRMTILLEGSQAPAPPAKEEAPRRLMNYTGFVTDASGRPLEGRQNLRFTVTRTGSAPLWSDAFEVEVKSGVFSVKLGERTPLPPEAFDLESRIEVTPAPQAAPAPSSAVLEATPAPGAPAPRARVLAGIQYWAQLGSFVDPARAMLLVKSLDSAGQKAGVASGRTKGVEYHMVRVGPFETKAQAQDAAAKLAAQGYPAIVVKR